MSKHSQQMAMYRAMAQRQQMAYQPQYQMPQIPPTQQQPRYQMPQLQPIVVQAPAMPKSMGMSVGGHIGWAILTFFTMGIAAPFWARAASRKHRSFRY
jgi:hypothetical protein